MIDLRHKKQRIVQSLGNYHLLHKTWHSEREKLTYTAGVLNSIWNLWNNFWGDYWIAHIIGGIYINGTMITPICQNYTKRQAIFFLLIKLGRRKVNKLGNSISGTHQEPTWGAINIIEELALVLQRNHNHLQILSQLIGHYKMQVEHFQQIRNSFRELE